MMQYRLLQAIQPSGRSIAPLIFLSCLFGSEHLRKSVVVRPFFLSCLFGSERVLYTLPDLRSFLSCLFGSELF